MRNLRAIDVTDTVGKTLPSSFNVTDGRTCIQLLVVTKHVMKIAVFYYNIENFFRVRNEYHGLSTGPCGTPQGMEIDFE
jgi:hypothetical protein